MSLKHPATVPQHWRGLWRRIALERADGTGDTATLVLWLQTDTLYADLRIPADRPAVRTFEPALAAQEGFAGHLETQGDVACWVRRIDYRPLGVPDVGRLSRARRVMVEHGVHDDYVEHWWLEAPGDDTAVLVNTANAVAVRAGDHLILARERRRAVPADLTAAVRTERDLSALLDCEISYAQRDGAGWRIVHSTLPWREGVHLAAQDLHDDGQS